MPKNSWEIKRSILFELDTLFTFLGDYLPRASLSVPINQLLDSIPPEMSAELTSMLGTGKHYFNILFPIGLAAHTEYEEDYSLATMPIRQMHLHEAILSLLTRAQKGGVETQFDTSIPLDEQFERVMRTLLFLDREKLGIDQQLIDTIDASLLMDIPLITRFLADGDLHDRFWHWLDRFFYQIYQPWRNERITQMAAEETRANMALGALKDQLVVDWLPQINPLRNSLELVKARENHLLNVTFLVEPFEMPDTWFIFEGGIVVTFTDNQESHEHFYGFVNHLSERLKALSDPNRLMIMRIVRGSSRDNTELASFLNLSRPTVSVHAKQLRETGLIKTYEVGRSVRHEVVAAEVRTLFHDLERFLDLPPEEQSKG